MQAIRYVRSLTIIILMTVTVSAQGAPRPGLLQAVRSYLTEDNQRINQKRQRIYKKNYEQIHRHCPTCSCEDALIASDKVLPETDVNVDGINLAIPEVQLELVELLIQNPVVYGELVRQIFIRIPYTEDDRPNSIPDFNRKLVYYSLLRVCLGTNTTAGWAALDVLKFIRQQDFRSSIKMVADALEDLDIDPTRLELILRVLAHEVDRTIHLPGRGGTRDLEEEANSPEFQRTLRAFEAQLLSPHLENRVLTMNFLRENFRFGKHSVDTYLFLAHLKIKSIHLDSALEVKFAAEQGVLDSENAALISDWFYNQFKYFL